MKRMLILTIVLGIALAFTSLVWAQSESESPKYDRGYYCPWGGPGPVWGMRPGLMERGWGMRPGLMGRGWDMGRQHRRWTKMTPEQHKEWKQMRSKFMKDTLELRQKLVSKQMEFQILWEEEKPDPTKMRTLSNEIAELQFQLEKKWREFLIQCRSTFGDKD